MEVPRVSFTPTSKELGTRDSNQWACVRYNPNNAWNCNGTNGCLNTTTMYNTWLVASPLSNR